ncbi:hypothetical protein VTH8203_01990 [Vibrio thalassae]|uniref:Uncharacterized protein n=1 Tax=Vibrio thalassae TaxID=1243014 RepID=A0A240EI51_9VIBR|nr:hypothetical protein VTH8203_01990 [Vibrio thalassae]
MAKRRSNQEWQALFEQYCQRRCKNDPLTSI